MNLLDLMVRIGVDDQVSGKLGGIGDKAKSALATVGKVGVAMAGAAAGAIGVTSKAALDAYASYEQLVGGVQTLFGAGGKTLEAYAESVGQTVDSASAKYGELIEAQEMFVYADAAYASAGVSANRYMEQATSFAASLVSSLGGDTKAAVEYADMAIRDMSDNANKMGTDVASIQWAYQGFAKQNYTMLDNLKLGYGGTKSEMERLISDANKIKEKMGEVGDLSIDSFADIVEAIHLVQVEMGVFGTTAEEAATTIQGSLGMLRASLGELVDASSARTTPTWRSSPTGWRGRSRRQRRTCFRGSRR